MSRPPARVDRLLIPSSALANTLQGLALGRDREMLCYWLGAALPADATSRSRAIVTTVAFPRILSDYNTFRVAEGQLGLLSQWCAERSLWVLGQVHTHPTDEAHSSADECWPASHRPGFLSVLIPFFAQLSTIREPHWRAYELLGQGRWDEIDPAVRFEILTDVWFSRLGDHV